MIQLLNHTYFSLFLIIVIGILVGRIKIKGVSLDVSAVIFVAIVFGHFGIIIPAEIQAIGLILFIYSIGIQAGPGFFDSFKSQGVKWSILAGAIVFTGFLVILASYYLFDLEAIAAIGIYTGALTSAPGLAAGIEASGSELVSIGYGIIYPIGVIGVILTINLLPRILKINITNAEKAYEQLQHEVHPELLRKHFKVENPNVFGKNLLELKVREICGANISRIKQNGVSHLCTTDTVFHSGDIIRAVGTAESLEKVKLLFGNETTEEINLEKKAEVRWVLVTNKSMVNKTLGQLNIFETYDATITRVRRAGLEITPKGSTSIRFGDKLLIASRGNFNSVSELFGNEEKKLNESDFLPVALGIIIGIIIGQIPLTLPGGVDFKLGITGGVLLSALTLSNLGKTGPVLWNVSGAANMLIRKIGLLFFLSAIGTHAGQSFVASLGNFGWEAIVTGIFVAIIPMVVAVLLNKWWLKVDFLTLLGLITGGMTSTPGLSAASSITESDAPTVAYATVYPVAMVSLIVFVKILSFMLL